MEQIADIDRGTGAAIIDKWRNGLMNSLRAAIKKQVCRYTIEDALAYLEEYAEVHFYEQEQYMRHYGYSELHLHKEKHEQFVRELFFLKAELHNIQTLGLKGSYEISVETVRLIADWIRDHILTNDRDFEEFLGRYPLAASQRILSQCGSKECVGTRVTICPHCLKIRGNTGLWKAKENYKEIPSELRTRTASALSVSKCTLRISLTKRDSPRTSSSFLHILTSP